MQPAAHLGRVGLAVALGIGAAMAFGHGVASAEPGDSTTSSASSDAHSSSTDAQSAPEAATADRATSAANQTPDATPSTAISSIPDSPSKDDTSTAPTTGVVHALGPTSAASSKRTKAPNRDSAATTSPPAELAPSAEPEHDPEAVRPSPDLAAPPIHSTDPAGDRATGDAVVHTVRVAAARISALTEVTSPSADPPAAAQTSLIVTPAPSLSSNPVGLLAGYVASLVTGVVDVFLRPLASSGGIPLPTEPPTLWTLLAFARREFFNASPRVDYVPGGTEQTATGLVVGNLGASDPDGDRLTYTLVNSPRYGGKVAIDQGTGQFVYVPTRAMAAIGGSDEFTVMVSDEGSGFHLHGPLGLLEFAPIASPVIALLSALPVIGSSVSTVVTALSHVPIIGDILQPFGGHGVAATITVTVRPTPGQNLAFPDDFHWGVATSSFQSEMGGGAPDAVHSDEWAFLHDPINQLLGIAPALPENGPGSYLRYETDAALAAGLGVDTFRTGIEWSRIFPNSTRSVDISDENGAVSVADLMALDALADQNEVQHYRMVFAALHAHQLDPMVTLNHYTLPTWLQDPTTLGGDRIPLQLGLPGSETGWLSPETPVEFRKYAAYLAWKYGDQVDTWLVLNEPGVYPLGGLLYLPGGPVPPFPPGVFRPDLLSTFLVNEATGYVAAAREIHRIDSGAQVGFSNSMSMFRPADPLNPLDVQAAKKFNAFYNGWFPDAVIRGAVDANLDGVISPDEIHPEMAGSADFLGVNYYATGTIRGFGVPLLPGFPALLGLPSRTFPADRCPTTQCSDTGQPVDPGGLREVLEFARQYRTPLWITENGIADADDSERATYILDHLAVVQDVIADGMDIRGYNYWTLVDNLEWSSGYGPKFGLYAFDPVTLERTPRPSVSVVRDITAANALPTNLLLQHHPIGSA